MKSTFENGYALLIGVSDQLNPQLAKPLPAIENDINALQKVLVHPDRCAYPENNVHVLRGKDATLENIGKEFAWLKESTSKEDTVVIYFSCHGGFKDGRYYLLPYDAAFDAFSVKAIENNALVSQIQALGADRLLLIIDSCHAGAVEDEVLEQNALKPLAAKPSIFLPPSPSNDGPTETVLDTEEGEKGFVDNTPNIPGLNNIIPPPDDDDDDDPDPSSKEANLESASHLLNQGRSRVVLTSCQGEQSSYIHKDSKISIFTHHIIEALTGHVQQPADVQTISVTDVMGYVEDAVPKSARAQGKEQVPNFDKTGSSFPLALVLGGAGVKAGATAPSVGETIGLTINITDNSVHKQNTSEQTGQGHKNAQDISGGSTVDFGTTNIDDHSGGIDNRQGQIDGDAIVGNKTITHSPNQEAIGELFQQLEQRIEELAAQDEELQVTKPLVVNSVAELKEEVAKPEVETSKIKKILGKIKRFAPPVLKLVAGVIADPRAGIAEGIRGIAQAIADKKEENV